MPIPIQDGELGWLTAALKRWGEANDRDSRRAGRTIWLVWKPAPAMPTVAVAARRRRTPLLSRPADLVVIRNPDLFSHHNQGNGR